MQLCWYKEEASEYWVVYLSSSVSLIALQSHASRLSMHCISLAQFFWGALCSVHSLSLFKTGVRCDSFDAFAPKPITCQCTLYRSNSFASLHCVSTCKQSNCCFVDSVASKAFLQQLRFHFHMAHFYMHPPTHTSQNTTWNASISVVKAQSQYSSAFTCINTHPLIAKHNMKW